MLSQNNPVTVNSLSPLTDVFEQIVPQQVADWTQDKTVLPYFPGQYVTMHRDTYLKVLNSDYFFFLTAYRVYIKPVNAASEWKKTN